MRKVMILNGPNLDRLGTREPDVYGTLSLQDIEKLCVETATTLKLEVDFRQTNDEATLISWLHEAAETKTFVIMNPAAFTHYSVAIRDAAAMLTAGLIEVHLSNPIAREEFRHTSLISGLATGTISGFGAQSYLLALQALVKL
ncbi:MAG: type II 3-dehydroquinate dehydratase [Actinobacteria bacterium]|nr:type II 3-dehydroquinate dehydratase [Actinomycetota bacterium]MSW25004.1 type II 3-dehydroquinate dehydratase [Actinomycetota bacterium]MSX29222.1 type II 3-dehydroquinate dehydratase [Actinomycetota bacterium]MSX44071.1 type II 3-dehydroquinate dehydratase [Actinomycetota bacterium]MSX97103.1 type II 3-dehydroquinate dehydratase [Actinomycetota bacterium]